MSEISKRIIFGLLYIFVIIIATNSNDYLFSIIFYTFMMFCTYEFNKMQNNSSIYPYILNSILYLTGVFVLFNLHNYTNYIGITLVLTLFFVFIINLFSKNSNPSRFLGNAFLNLIYIGLPFVFIVFIHDANPDIHGAVFKLNYVLSIFILLWVNDTFAYLTGKKFGKHKLFERISPKKTIEGFIGGLIFTLIFGFIISKINVLQMQNGSLLYNYKLWLVISLIVSVFGTLGDLIESKFKREANIKDSSNLIPGHGGFLDRLDSFIFATPFIFIYIISNL